MSENRPTHNLFHVSDRKAKDGESKAVWTQIAPCWQAEKGAIAGDIPAGITLAGRFVLLPVKDGQSDSTGDGDKPKLADT